MISMLVRALAVFVIALVAAFAGFVVGSMVFALFGLEISGRQGYEAGGPLGCLLGLLLGLIAGIVLLFRKRNTSNPT